MKVIKGKDSLISNIPPLSSIFLLCVEDLMIDEDYYLIEIRDNM
jgi:hypothetical protein